MTTIDRVLAVAAKYIGMKESPAGSNKGPILIFGGKGGPWCAAFVCHVWHEATGKYPASCGFTRGTGTLWGAAGKDGTRRFTPERGMLFYKPRYENGRRVGGHVGFVVKVHPDGKRFDSIEGNVSDMVRRYTRDTKDCIGFIQGMT